MDKGMLCASVYDQGTSSTIYKVFDLSKVDWSKSPTEVAETIKGSSAELTYKGEFMSIDSKGPTYQKSNINNQTLCRTEQVGHSCSRLGFAVNKGA